MCVFMPPLPTIHMTGLYHISPPPFPTPPQPGSFCCCVVCSPCLFGSRTWFQFLEFGWMVWFWTDRKTCVHMPLACVWFLFYLPCWDMPFALFPTLLKRHHLPKCVPVCLLIHVCRHACSLHASSHISCYNPVSSLSPSAVRFCINLPSS